MAKARRSHAGRVCKRCGKRLSVYNLSKECYTHSAIPTLGHASQMRDKNMPAPSNFPGARGSRTRGVRKMPMKGAP